MMKTNYLCLLFLVLAWAMVVTPAAACAVAIEKTAPVSVCTNCEFNYTLKVFYEGNAGYAVKVSDILPTGVTYVSSSDGGIYSPAIRAVCWTFSPMPAVPNYADKNKWWNKTVIKQGKSMVPPANIVIVDRGTEIRVCDHEGGSLLHRDQQNSAGTGLREL
jgi:Domain of unknown function DUF11